MDLRALTSTASLAKSSTIQRPVNPPTRSFAHKVQRKQQNHPPHDSYQRKSNKMKDMKEIAGELEYLVSTEDITKALNDFTWRRDKIFQKGSKDWIEADRTVKVLSTRLAKKKSATSDSMPFFNTPNPLFNVNEQQLTNRKTQVNQHNTVEALPFGSGETDQSTNKRGPSTVEPRLSAAVRTVDVPAWVAFVFNRLPPFPNDPGQQGLILFGMLILFEGAILILLRVTVRMMF